MKRKILFFTCGDANDIRTWSNVPYLFSSALMVGGVGGNKLILINLQPRWLMYFGKLYNMIGWRISRMIYRKNEYCWERTSIYRNVMNRIVRKSILQNPDADLCIILCYDYDKSSTSLPNGVCHPPVLLFGDWTFDILISDRLGRKLYFFEQEYSDYEQRCIRSADFVVSLFPKCTARMKKDNPTANIHFLGDNVINVLYDKPIDIEELITEKHKAKTILFVGRKAYKEGAKLLVDSFNSLSADIPNLQLHIIGMTARDIGIKESSNIHCYGYLDKATPEDNKIYYKLLCAASVFVNPTPLWGGFSSTIEAMYFGTPIIVSNYEDFVDYFGSEIDFGCYNHVFNKQCLSQNIKQVLTSCDYEKMCRNAHNRVKSFTWDSYVDRVLALVDKNINCYENNKYNNCDV